MWDQVIGQVMTGLAGIITAIGGVMLARGRQMQADLAACRSESATLEATHRMWRITALRHIRSLEKLLQQAGMSVLDRPDELL